MILPGKHISLDYSLLGIGGKLLGFLERPHTVSSLWEQAKTEPGIATFERFVMALTLLYTVGALDWDDGLLRRSEVAR